jgi:hypothetical protein
VYKYFKINIASNKKNFLSTIIQKKNFKKSLIKTILLFTINLYTCIRGVGIVKKENEIWTVVTPKMHKLLKEYAQQNQLASTRAKMILYILYHFHPEQLLEDYTFQSRTGKMINIKVSDAELSYIKELAKRYNVTISRLLRNMVYTFFINIDKEKPAIDLINYSFDTDQK